MEGYEMAAFLNEDPDSYLSRRQWLRMAIGVSGSLVVGGLLAACGGSNVTPTVTPAPPRGAGTPSQTNSSSVAANVSASSPPSPGAKAGGEITYALTNKFDTLDPNVTTATDVGRVTRHLFDPLVWQPKPSEFIPGLAAKWEISPTSDQYTFHLRTDVTFHDGTPFNADAVRLTLDRIVNPDLKSQTAFSLIGPYDSSAVLDPSTVVGSWDEVVLP